MKLGITQYSACPDGTTGTELLNQVVNLGVAGLEPFFAANDDKMFSWPRNEIKRFALEAKKMNVCIPSTAVGIFNNDSSLIDKNKKGKAVDIIKKTLEFSAAAGSKIMLLCTYIHSDPNTPEKKAVLLDVIREIEPLARSLGVAIALESPLSAEELVRLVDLVKSDYVGVYYDIGNAIALGFDNNSSIKTLGKRILAVHIKDSINKLGSLHIGDGYLNLVESIESLKKINYQGWLMLETPGGNNLKLKEDIKIIQQYL